MPISTKNVFFFSTRKKEMNEKNVCCELNREPIFFSVRTNDSLAIAHMCTTIKIRFWIIISRFSHRSCMYVCMQTFARSKSIKCKRCFFRYIYFFRISISFFFLRFVHVRTRKDSLFQFFVFCHFRFSVSIHIHTHTMRNDVQRAKNLSKR